jgi:hypothetical protein
MHPGTPQTGIIVIIIMKKSIHFADHAGMSILYVSSNYSEI